MKMKKKSLIILAVLLIILVPTYVGAMNKKNPSNLDKPVNVEPQRNEGNKGITVNQLDILYVEEDKAQELLGEKYTNLRELKGYKVITVNNETYLYIGLGEKSTGGYGIEVTRLEDNEGILNVEVNVIQPKPGDMVTQVITYPHKILKLNFTPKEVNVKSSSPKDTFTDLNLKK